MAVRTLPPESRARLTRRRAPIVAAAFAIAGVLCLTLAARADPEPARVTARPQRDARLTTPLWSPRRVPAVFSASVAAAKLQRLLSEIVAPYSSCVAVSGADGPIVGIHVDAPLAGASTQKLLVAAAAIAVLGPNDRFETRAVTRAPLRAGELGGDLTIVGGGDPVLSTTTTPSTAAAPVTPLAELADAIVRAGVRRINGSLVADDSRYDRERAVPDWKPSEIAEGDVGALGALIVDGGRGNDGLAAPDPALTTVQKLATLLTARGVPIRNGVRDPGRAAGTGEREVARVSSPPLVEIVKEMLTVSNDETAEELTRELGAAKASAGTTAAGTRAIPATLARLGVPVTGVLLRDGSGLAPGNRVTCAALTGTVALGRQPRFAAILDGLAIASRSGTLITRFGGTPLAGRLRAKTGHIDGVVGLAGVIDATVRFAFVANGNFSTSTGEGLQDQIALSIGAYVDSPDTGAPIPAPR